MEAKKFTFKTEKPAGRWNSFSSSEHYIKFKKQQVGLINPTAPHKIRLQIIKPDINEDGNPNCDWKWITLKKEFTSIQEAKDFLNVNIELIFKTYNLKLLED